MALIWFLLVFNYYRDLIVSEIIVLHAFIFIEGTIIYLNSFVSYHRYPLYIFSILNRKLGDT